MWTDVNILYCSNGEEKIVKYMAYDHTKVFELLKYLYYTVQGEKYVNDSYERAELLGCFTFYLGDTSQKAILDYPLLKFLNNFGYDLNNIKIVYDQAYGIGAECYLKEIATIKIYGNESNHMNRPHVHVCKIGKKDKGVSISLNTFKPFKDCEEQWIERYSNKERKIIISFLSDNSDKLMDFYNRYTKGEYITEDYTLLYDGEEYSFYTGRTY